jgi:predicted restriction endonuclease
VPLRLVEHSQCSASDLHILFDRGLIAVTKDLQVEVSNRIKEEYENGRDYYALQGKAVNLRGGLEGPALEFIEYHNERVFAA